MLANQVTIELRPADLAIETVARMEALATRGDWSDVEQLTVRLRHTVLEVPESERQAVIVTIGHCLDRLQTKVLESRGEVSEKLTDIRRGRAANIAYGQPDRRDANSALR